MSARTVVLLRVPGTGQVRPPVPRAVPGGPSGPPAPPDRGGGDGGGGGGGDDGAGQEPDGDPGRRPWWWPSRLPRSTLLTSLGVSGLLVIVYALLIGAAANTAMADAVVRDGAPTTASTVLVRPDGHVYVTIPQGTEQLDYVSDPEGYRAPLTVWVAPRRGGRLTLAASDLPRLRSPARRALLRVGFGGLGVAVLVATIVFNAPGRRHRPRS